MQLQCPPPPTRISKSLDTLDHSIRTPIPSLKPPSKMKNSLPHDILVKNMIGQFGLMFPLATLLITKLPHCSLAMLSMDALWTAVLTGHVTASLMPSHEEHIGLRMTPQQSNSSMRKQKKKISNGYTRVTTWGEIKDNIPPR